MHFVNWQRDVFVDTIEGRKVVVKRNKATKVFHEFIISYTYSLISLLLAHPSSPVALRQIAENEGHQMRAMLTSLGISTPELIGISEHHLVEEFVEGGDLYHSLASVVEPGLAFAAGAATGRLHRAGYAFIDNKAQNYLVRGGQVLRTDLGFIKKSKSEFAKSMDIGSFLASVIDLEAYPAIEKAFFQGYLTESGQKFSSLGIIIRNLLSFGFSSNASWMYKNMMLDSRPLLY